MAPERDRLPFEPAKNRKKPVEKGSSDNPSADKSPSSSDKAADKAKKPLVSQAVAKARESTARQAVVNPGGKSGSTQSASTQSASTQSVQATTIPQVVSQRMARRMAFFCGIPTTLGVTVFFACYWVVSHNWYELPTAAVVLLSMGCFGLGVLGLSYGVLSASWEEETAGSLIGWNEFTTNFGRMTAAWRSSSQKPKQKD